MIIGVDLDDVLVDTTKALIEFHNEKYKTSLIIDQRVTYNLWEFWGGTREEAVQKVFEFYDSNYFKNIKPVPSSVWGVEKLSKDHELVVVTSRLEPSIEETNRWIEKYFSGKFKDIYFATNYYAQDNKEKSKLEICLELNVDILIEDSFEYAEQCVDAEIEVLLLSCPWNEKYKKLPKRITRALNWRDILDILSLHKD